MNIELTELEKQFLIEFSKKQYEGAKDNIGTITPIHVVERLERLKDLSGCFINTYHPVAFFLIRDEAVRYKEGYQAHNCGDCRIYTYGLGYSNYGDLPVFRNLLMRIGTELGKQ